MQYLAHSRVCRATAKFGSLRAACTGQSATTENEVWTLSLIQIRWQKIINIVVDLSYRGIIIYNKKSSLYYLAKLSECETVHTVSSHHSTNMYEVVWCNSLTVNWPFIDKG